MKEQIDNELKNITFNFDMDKMLCKKNRKKIEINRVKKFFQSVH